MIRINKYLSICGVTSRRGAERLIESGQVTINGKTVEELGTLVDETLDIVKVNGTIVDPVENKEYLIFNKPASVMTTLHDPFKRKTVAHYLKKLKTRVYPVGRLDYDTRGVILMTNDGDLAYRLTHPKYQIKRIYEAKVKGKFDETAADNIAKGIKLEDGAIGKAKVDILEVGPNWARIRLVLTEGRKREVKQLCKGVGHPVLKLVRIEFAGLDVKGLGSGKWRHLLNTEIVKLKKMVGL
ncbi:MAG: pseudouridine synthase [candidate division Zixibacteria bacterium]|nr:pseudouridine synthase [candidate division Zixibacteria bacterium]